MCMVHLAFLGINCLTFKSRYIHPTFWLYSTIVVNLFNHRSLFSDTVVLVFEGCHLLQLLLSYFQSYIVVNHDFCFLKVQL